MNKPEDMAKRVEQYIMVRDRLKQIDEEYDAKRKPFLEVQERLSGILRAFMETHNLENLKTDAGTCYTSVRHTASVADADLFMKYVIENGRFELLDRRANPTAVKAFVEETKQLPPGVNLNAVQTVGVRRPRA